MSDQCPLYPSKQTSVSTTGIPLCAISGHSPRYLAGLIEIKVVRREKGHA
jgi:hypothetical protein